MNDLTIIYLTANEMPDCWTDFAVVKLLEAAGDMPMISVSRKPIKLRQNILDDGPKGYWNIYMQMLRAAEIATTPFVAVAEDDVLYTREHFTEYRPAKDNVAFDHSRWSLFAWEEDPIFCLRQRVSNCSMIASREYLIECLVERKTRWPNGPEGRAAKWIGEVGRSKVDYWLDVKVRHEAEEFWCTNPIVHLNHLAGTDTGDYGRTSTGKHMVKKHGQVKAIEIPFWGKAADIVKHYDNRPTHSEVLEPSSQTKSAVVSPQRYEG